MGEQGAESIHARIMKLERDYRGIKDELDSLKYIDNEQALYTAPSLSALRPPIKRVYQMTALITPLMTALMRKGMKKMKREIMKRPLSHPSPPYWFSVVRKITISYSLLLDL